MSTILIVDADHPNCDVLAELLRRSGHQADCMHDRQGALAWLKKTRADLVLVDLASLGQAEASADGGIEFIREMRGDADLRDLRVAIWSAVTDQTALVEAERLGVIDYFVKTRSDWPQLHQRIEALMGR